MKCIYSVFIAVLLTSCSSKGLHDSLSYETRVRRAQVALGEQKIFEARRWASEALTMRPNSLEAQKLIAEIIDREIVLEKSSHTPQAVEEMSADERRLQIKTWLERSRGFLQAHEFEQAILAAEQIFLLDPENREASRQIDEIKIRVRELGKDETLILEDVYKEEIQTRLERYDRQAETWLDTNRLGAARLTIEKMLLLDPENARAHALLALLEEREKGEQA